MRDRVLGRSGIRVSELCLGTMMFGSTWTWRSGADESASRRIYEAYREAGGYFVDTANIYGDSEQIVGRLIGPERDAIVVATKFTLESDPADPNSAGSHRKNLRRSLEASLRRLGTDHVDLLWVHAWDQRTALEETLRGLDDAVRAGKVLAVGLSNTPAWVVSRAVTLAEARGWCTVSAIQVEHSLARRTAEREMLPMARSFGLAVTGWAPLARGLLAGKEVAQAKPHDIEIVGVVRQVAGELDTSPARVALAWTMRKGVVPVVGATKVEQLRDSLGAVDVNLSTEHLAQLDEASAVDLGYPHEFLELKAATLGPSTEPSG
jgi:aryl-alcohol dehydrogenase-like predicted oxidoreductase